jgi:hypothetical protein
MATGTTTIRVTTTTRDRLSAIAKRRGKTTGDLLAELAEELDDDALMGSAERSWRSMSNEELAEYRQEAEDLERFTAPLDPE